MYIFILEHVWAYLKRQGPWDQVARNPDALWERVNAAWLRLQENVDLVPSLFDSMPGRVQEIITQNGAMTRY